MEQQISIEDLRGNFERESKKLKKSNNELKKVIFKFSSMLGFSQPFLSTMPVNYLLEIILYFSLGQTGSSKGFIILRSSDDIYSISTAKGFENKTSIRISENDRIFRFLRKNNSPVLIKGIPVKSELINYLKKLGMYIVFPVIKDNILKGLLVLGRKKSRRQYSNYEKGIINFIFEFAILSIENSQLSEKIYKLNLEFRKNIDEKLKEIESQIISKSKLSTTGELVAGIAHEIRNPLSIISSMAQVLNEKLIDRPFEYDYVQDILGEAKRIERFIQELLNFIKPWEVKFEKQNLVDIANSTLMILKKQLKRQNIDLEIETQKNIPIQMLDKNGIQQVIMNTTLNSIDAIPKSGKIRVEIKRTLLKDEENETFDLINNRLKRKKFEGRFVIMSIEDDGMGISEVVKRKIFDPFFTTKTEGIGLGLSICRRIIERHNGFVRVETKLGFGTKFNYYLPV